MGQSIPNLPMTGRVWHLADLLARMIERVGAGAMAARLDRGAGLLEAHARCHGCIAARDCERFLADGDAAAPIPEFCPNAAFFRRCIEMTREESTGRGQ